MRRRDIYLFYAVVIIYWFSTNTYVPIMTPYLKEIGIGYGMIGIIGGAYGLMQILVRLPLGMISDKLNKRRIFVIGGVAVSAVSSMGLFFTENSAAILILRGLAGVAASSWVIMTVLFAGYFEKGKSAENISFLTMMNNLGMLLAMIFGGMAAGLYGYKASFLIGGAAGIIGAVMSLFIKEDKREVQESVSAGDLLGVLKEKSLICSAVLCLMVQFIAFGATNTFTSEAAARIGANGTELGIISVVMTIPRVLSSMVCGVLFSKGIKNRSIVSVSFVITAAACIVTPLAGNMAVIYAGSVLTGIGTGTAYAALISTCTDGIEENKKSTAMGAFQAIFGMGTFLGPVVIGGIAESYGINVGFYFAAFTAVITAGVSMLIL